MKVADKLTKQELSELDFDPTEEPKMYWTLAPLNFWSQDQVKFMPLINIGIGKQEFYVYTSYFSFILFGLGFEIRKGINLQRQYGNK